MHLHRTLLFVMLTTLMGTEVRSQTPPNPAVMAPARLSYYRTGLPEAQRFEMKVIPAAMLAPVDKDNDKYLLVYDKNEQLIGYLRDFFGPVSASEVCPCNPLNFTMVFDTKLELRTLIAPAPFQKWGHEAMTAEEQTRLVNLVRQPSQALMRVRRVEDVVDATTGATRVALAPDVVARAGLSTRRIAGVVRDTRDILRGAPVGRDRARLHAIYGSRMGALSVAKDLAAFLPQMETDELKPQVYHMLLTHYVQALASAPGGDAAIEAQLLDTSVLPKEVAGDALVSACYTLADRGLRLGWVDLGIAALSKPNAPTTAPGLLQLLRGTARFMGGDKPGAIASLQEARRKISVRAAPEMYRRLGAAFKETKQLQSACEVGRELYVDHPLMPEVGDLLGACVTPTQGLPQVLQALASQARTALLAGRIKNGPTLQPLALENSEGQAVQVTLANPGKVTVALFFATWCPHCRAEMPRVKAFAKALVARPDWRERVQMVGIRTAVESETESYAAFAKQFSPNFPVYTDPTMSLTFGDFAKKVGIPAALPAMAVIDETGTVRFLLEPGDYRDTQQELAWTVESLLPPTKK